MSKTLLVSATKHTLESLPRTKLYQSLFDGPAQTWGNENGIVKYYEGADSRHWLDAFFFVENTKGLPNIYNQALEIAEKEQYLTLILVHDDVSIEDALPLVKIQQQFDYGFEVVGLAGAQQCKLQEPALWHLMSDRANWRGAVAHPDGNGKVWMTSFGATPDRVLTLDGLFLALNPTLVNAKGVKFDEQFTFHLYDIDFSLSCNKAGLKMCTAPIWCMHSSPGLRSLEDPVYLESQKRFLAKWKSAYLLD